MRQTLSKLPQRSLIFWVITSLATFWAALGLIGTLYVMGLQIHLVFELMSADEDQKTMGMMWKVTREGFFLSFLPAAMYILASNAALFALIVRRYAKAKVLILTSVICHIGLRLIAGDLSLGPDLESHLRMIFGNVLYISVIVTLFLYAKKYQARDANVLAAM